MTLPVWLLMCLSGVSQSLSEGAVQEQWQADCHADEQEVEDWYSA